MAHPSGANDFVDVAHSGSCAFFPGSGSNSGCVSLFTALNLSSLFTAIAVGAEFAVTATTGAFVMEGLVVTAQVGGQTRGLLGKDMALANVNFATQAPEPGTVAMLGAGLLISAAASARRRRNI